MPTKRTKKANYPGLRDRASLMAKLYVDETASFSAGSIPPRALH